MARPVLVGSILALALLVGFAQVGEDSDPEPNPRVGSWATSGDLTIRVDKSGLITATNKRGQNLWVTAFMKGVAVDAKGQVVIASDYAVIAQADFVYSLEKATGRIVWSTARDFRSAVLSVKEEKVTLKQGGKRQVIDQKTGKVLESVR